MMSEQEITEQLERDVREALLEVERKARFLVDNAIQTTARFHVKETSLGRLRAAIQDLDNARRKVESDKLKRRNAERTPGSFLRVDAPLGSGT